MLHPGIRNIRCNLVIASRHAVRTDGRGICIAGDLSAGAVPGVVQRVVGIEVAAYGGRRRGFARHDRTWVDRTAC